MQYNYTHAEAQPLRGVCVCECVCGVWMCVCVQNGFEVCTTLAYPHIHLVLCHYTHTNMQSRII